MNKLLSGLEARWPELETRERLSLALGSGFLLVLATYFLVMAPALEFYRDGRDRFQQTRELDEWLIRNSTALQRSATGHVATTSGASGPRRSLVTVVSETASVQSIRIGRIEPGDNNVRVWVEGVEFTALLTWRADLRAGSGVLAQEVVLDGSGDGRVAVRLQLASMGN